MLVTLLYVIYHVKNCRSINCIFLFFLKSSIKYYVHDLVHSYYEIQHESHPMCVLVINQSGEKIGLHNNIPTSTACTFRYAVSYSKFTYWPFFKRFIRPSKLIHSFRKFFSKNSVKINKQAWIKYLTVWLTELTTFQFLPSTFV